MDQIFIMLQYLDYKTVFLTAFIIQFLFLFLYLIYKNKKLEKQFKHIEHSFQQISVQSLTFKFNKLKALSMIDPALLESFHSIQNNYEQLKKDVNSCSIELGKCERLIDQDDLKQARKVLKKCDETINNIQIAMTELHKELDYAIQKEHQIIQINNDLKKEFEIYQLQLKRITHNDSLSFIDEQVNSLSKLFVQFDQCMLSNEFVLGNKVNHEIINQLNEFKDNLKIYPTLYELIYYINYLYEDIWNQYTFNQSKGSNLDYLEIEYNLELIRKKHQADLERLKENINDDILNSLNETLSHLKSLYEEIQNKEDKQETVNKRINDISQKLMHLYQEWMAYQTVLESISKDIQVNCLFEFKQVYKRLNELIHDRDVLIQAINDKNTKTASLLPFCNYLTSELNQLTSEFKTIKEEIRKCWNQTIRR